MPKPIELYYWPTPNGWKVTIAFEEMGLPYVVRPVNITTGEQFRPEFIRINPNNRMPAIVDPEGPDGEPIALFESGLILMYLGRKSGLLYGTDERSRLDIEQWVMWQMAGLGPMVGQAAHFRVYAPVLADDPAHAEYGASRYTKEVNRLYGVLERRLEGREYLAADAFSIADIACWPAVAMSPTLGQDLTEFPRLQAWFQRIERRPSIVRAQAVLGDRRRRMPGTSTDDDRAIQRISFGQTAKSVEEAIRASA